MRRPGPARRPNPRLSNPSELDTRLLDALCRATLILALAMWGLAAILVIAQRMGVL